MQLNSVAVTFEKGRKGHIDVNMKHNFRLFPKETRRQQQKTRYRFGFVKSLNRILFSVASLHSASLSIQLWMHRFNEFSSWMCVWCVARHFAICIIISSVVTLFTLSLCQPMQSNSTSDGIAHFEMILNSERMSQLQEFLHLMRRMRLCVCKPLAIVVRNCGATFAEYSEQGTKFNSSVLYVNVSLLHFDVTGNKWMKKIDTRSLAAAAPTKFSCKNFPTHMHTLTKC